MCVCIARPRNAAACLPACIHYMQISIICTNQTHKICQQQQQQEPPPPPAGAAAQQRIIIIIDFIMASRDRRPRSPLLLLLLLPSSIGRRTTNVQFNFCASFALLRSLCVCVCASFIGKQEEP